MGTRSGNIAAMNATSGIDLEKKIMTKNDLYKEAKYEATMSIARNMLQQGLINEQEYNDFNTKMIEKYQPFFGTLFTEIP